MEFNLLAGIAGVFIGTLLTWAFLRMKIDDAKESGQGRGSVRTSLLLSAFRAESSS